jgi:hypothetical protein
MNSSARAVIVGLGFTVALAIAVVVVLFTVGRDRSTSQLGDDVYGLRAATIRRNSPLLIPDPLGGDRAIWVTHVGADETTGYFAFTAIGEDGCVIEIDRETLDLHNACTGLIVAPDGGGLAQYPVVFDDGRLDIDINFDQR